MDGWPRPTFGKPPRDRSDYTGAPRSGLSYTSPRRYSFPSLAKGGHRRFTICCMTLVWTRAMAGLEDYPPVPRAVRRGATGSMGNPANMLTRAKHFIVIGGRAAAGSARPRSAQDQRHGLIRR